MRHLAIGDIHGCLKALLTLAEAVPFRATDVLVTLGDYVDRGPDSAGVLEWIIRRHALGGLIPLRGNHELMMLAARQSSDDLQSWLASGGVATLRSYSPVDDAGKLSDVPDEHWSLLESKLLPYYETDRCIFVHAGVCADLTMAEQPDYMMYWEAFDDPAAHESGKTVICGHTSQKSGEPKSVGHAVCIDTWACGRGWLTCFDAESGQYWQANQEGRVRSGWMSDHE